MRMRRITFLLSLRTEDSVVSLLQLSHYGKVSPRSIQAFHWLFLDTTNENTFCYIYPREPIRH